MTCVLVFLQFNGPAQLGTGAMITFVFLVINVVCRPFITTGLNSLQTFSLVSQWLTLFVGIMIGYTDAKDKLEDDGKGYDQADRFWLAVLILVSNGFVCAWPIARKWKTDSYSGYIQSLLWLVNLPLRLCRKKSKPNLSEIAHEQRTRAQTVSSLSAVSVHSDTMQKSSVLQQHHSSKVLAPPEQRDADLESGEQVRQCALEEEAGITVSQAVQPQLAAQLGWRV